MADAVKNIHQRLAAITGEVSAVGKTGKNTEQKYDYIEYDAVTAVLRPLMAKHGITVLQNTIKDGRHATEITSKYGQKGTHLVVDYTFTVTNVDDPTDNLEFLWQGEATDYGDKATNKAATAAEKYFLLKLFKIGTKEDPDSESPDHGTVAKKEVKQETAKPASGNGVELAKSWELKNLQIAARKVIGNKTDAEVNVWLEQVLNVRLNQLPRAWVAKAAEKLADMPGLPTYEELEEIVNDEAMNGGA